MVGLQTISTTSPIQKRDASQKVPTGTPRITTPLGNSNPQYNHQTWIQIVSSRILRICKHYYKGNLIYFMKQVNNFAVSASSKQITESIVDSINDEMTVKVRSLSIIN